MKFFAVYWYFNHTETELPVKIIYLGRYDNIELAKKKAAYTSVNQHCIINEKQFKELKYSFLVPLTQAVNDRGISISTCTNETNPPRKCV